MNTKPYINELKDRQELRRVFLVTGKELKKTRDNKPYLNLQLADKTGQIAAKMWDDNNNIPSLADSFNKDDFIYVTGLVEDNKKYGLQLIIKTLNRTEKDKIDLSDFAPQTKQDIDLLFAQLKETMESIRNPHLAKLITRFLQDKEFVDAFKRAPASVKYHQNYIGGLLEHTVTLLKLSRSVLVCYPALNPDLFLTGIFLHDIGKIKEYKMFLKAEHTDEGRLSGHTVIGVLMLEEKVSQVKDFPGDLLMQLRHLLISHHGERMYGAPVVPMTAEAMALHYLDHLDATVSEYYSATENLPPGTNWTNWIDARDCRFYRP